MADDRYLRWQAEQAGTSRGPSAGAALAMFAVIALVLLALIWSPAFATDRGGTSTRPPRRRRAPPSSRPPARR